jgi:hypothetical protein
MAYRLHVRGGLVLDAHTRVQECGFQVGEPVAVALDVRGDHCLVVSNVVTGGEVMVNVDRSEGSGAAETMGA